MQRSGTQGSGPWPRGERIKERHTTDTKQCPMLWCGALPCKLLNLTRVPGECGVSYRGQGDAPASSEGMTNRTGDTS